MQRYEKYKDSGVAWLGEIPEDWEVKAFKRFAVICNGRDHKGVWDVNGEYPIIGSGGIFGRANKYLYDKPSVILGRKGTIDKPQFVTDPFWGVDTTYFTDIYTNTDKRFFYYLCLTINFDLYKYGSAVPSMTQEVLSQIPFCSPRTDEQTAIANYLDRKTAEIDQLVAQKERLLKLYEEEKTAIINSCVTRGINPDVKLKESGIEWLGEIPEGWEVKRFKYLFNLIKDKNELYLPKIGLENIESKTGNYLETDTDFEGDGIHFKVNDILFGKLRPYLAKVYLANFQGKAVGDFYVFRCNSEIDKKYALNLILSEKFIAITNGSTFGSKMPRVAWDFIANLEISYPKKKEQTAIVQHIETETARINAKISKTKKIIALQKEYRTALISEAVTGKIKVAQKTIDNPICKAITRSNWEITEPLMTKQENVS